MSKIETGRYSERLRRSLGMKGVTVVSAELSPEISPVIVLEDNALEWQFLQAVRACGSAILEDGAVSFQTLIRWNNPVGSGIIAVFRHLDISADALTTINWGYGNNIGELLTARATAVFDHRWATATSPTAVTASSSDDATVISLASSIFVTRSVADTPYHWDGEVILLPGESLELGSGSTQLAVRVNTRWTERQLPALEQ